MMMSSRNKTKFKKKLRVHLRRLPLQHLQRLPPQFHSPVSLTQKIATLEATVIISLVLKTPNANARNASAAMATEATAAISDLLRTISRECPRTRKFGLLSP